MCHCLWVGVKFIRHIHRHIDRYRPTHKKTVTTKCIKRIQKWQNSVAKCHRLASFAECFFAFVFVLVSPFFWRGGGNDEKKYKTHKCRATVVDCRCDKTRLNCPSTSGFAVHRCVVGAISQPRCPTSTSTGHFTYNWPVVTWSHWPLTSNPMIHWPLPIITWPRWPLTFGSFHNWQLFSWPLVTRPHSPLTGEYRPLTSNSNDPLTIATNYVTSSSSDLLSTDQFTTDHSLITWPHWPLARHVFGRGGCSDVGCHLWRQHHCFDVVSVWSLLMGRSALGPRTNGTPGVCVKLHSTRSQPRSGGCLLVSRTDIILNKFP